MGYGVSYMSWGWDHILANLLFLDHVFFASLFNPLGTDLTNSYIPGHYGTFCFHLKNHTSLNQSCTASELILLQLKLWIHRFMSSPKITNVPFQSLSRVICGQNFQFLPLMHSSFVTKSSNFCHWRTHSLLSTSAPMVPYQLSHTVHPSINSVYELTTYINLLNVWSHFRPWSCALLHSVHRSSYNFSVPSHCMNSLENLPWRQQWLYTSDRRNMCD